MPDPRITTNRDNVCPFLGPSPPLSLLVVRAMLHCDRRHAVTDSFTRQIFCLGQDFLSWLALAQITKTSFVCLLIWPCPSSDIRPLAL